jgi:hypothetical protein
LSYRPARLQRLAELFPWNRFLCSLKFKNSGSGELFEDHVNGFSIALDICFVFTVQWFCTTLHANPLILRKKIPHKFSGNKLVFREMMKKKRKNIPRGTTLFGNINMNIRVYISSEISGPPLSKAKVAYPYLGSGYAKGLIFCFAKKLLSYCRVLYAENILCHQRLTRTSYFCILCTPLNIFFSHKRFRQRNTASC